MISILVGLVFLITVSILLFSAFFILSKIKWAHLTSNERSQLISLSFPIFILSVFSIKILSNPLFLQADLCFMFSFLFGTMWGVSNIQRKFFFDNPSRWTLLLRPFEHYVSVFFLVAALVLLCVGFVI
ncbi:hypothetical protein EB093_08300 [bacterium]|nr:hypothetical protein [bacterium]